MDTVTRVPFPFSRQPILNVPPSRAARSLMPSSPSEFVLLISAREMPRPLSVTSNLIRPSLSFKSTVTCVAPA